MGDGMQGRARFEHLQVKQLSLGGTHSAAVVHGDGVYIWGTDFRGSLGLGPVMLEQMVRWRLSLLPARIPLLLTAFWSDTGLRAGADPPPPPPFLVLRLAAHWWHRPSGPLGHLGLGGHRGPLWSWDRRSLGGGGARVGSGWEGCAPLPVPAESCLGMQAFWRPVGPLGAGGEIPAQPGWVRPSARRPEPPAAGWQALRRAAGPVEGSGGVVRIQPYCLCRWGAVKQDQRRQALTEARALEQLSSTTTDPKLWDSGPSAPVMLRRSMCGIERRDAR